MTDLLQREVGWLITKEHNELEGIPTRVGWGQLRVHAQETEGSFANLVGRTIFMDKSLTEHMIPDGAKVRWRSFEDDGLPAFDGIVNVAWIFSDDPNWSELAYNIDRFNETDVGAVWVWYSVEDILACAKALSRPTWERFALGHVGQRELPDSDGRWIQIYS